MIVKADSPASQDLPKWVRILMVFIGKKWCLLWILLGTILLCSPAIFVGFALDDFIHQAKFEGLEGMPIMQNPLFEWFSFVYSATGKGQFMRDMGEIPWWAPAHLSISFFRPLSALTHLFDHWLWSEKAWIHHVHSLLWYLLLIIIVAKSVSQVLVSRTLGTLVALMFAWAHAHYLAVAWIANRNALISITLGLLALMFHDRWRKSRDVRLMLVSLLFLTSALLAGECAVGCLGFFVSYQLFLEERTHFRHAWLKRLLPLLPAAFVLVVWQVLYRALGFGAFGSGSYLDPVANPIGFLTAIIARVPILLSGVLPHVSIDMLSFCPPSVGSAVAVVSAILCLLLLLLFMPLLRKSAEARFFAVGSLLASIPLAAAIPMDRQTLLIGIGLFGLLGCQIKDFGWLNGERLDQGSKRASIVLLLLFLCTIASPLLLPLRIGSFYLLNDHFMKRAAQLPYLAAPTEQTVIWVNGGDIELAEAMAIRTQQTRKFPGRQVLLAPEGSALDLLRLDSKSLRICTEESFFPTYKELLFYDPDRPLVPGDQIDLKALRIVVNEINGKGLPICATFSFDRDLDHPSYVWRYFRKGKAEIFQLPAIGAKGRIEKTTLWDLMNAMT